MPQAVDDTDIAALAEALRPAILKVSRRLRQEAQKVGLSIQDATLLAYIRKNPGVGVSALAEAEGTAKPTMSAHVKRLEAEGLVARSDNADDGRRSGLSITAAGARKLEALRRGRNDWLVGRLSRLGEDERALLAAAAPALFRLVEP
ncbi:MarR family transcriptional regulator [Phenylobacterium sp.]|uniref:MarR family winged helix-turn-helix transcriptional regulator n=1 Tax=Phenylobacterium sp. TaxID=1871053 RepID=UPI0025DDA6B9|nr:MarR family transcriptional regulator [Phenylobacterium sp.]MBX3484916.1 MarR family transcriptional regulator [Phenylobacterium sp.]MCW5758423.1 MarR family transcriptional regulator [Phenylobacterium sp.]